MPKVSFRCLYCDHAFQEYVDERTYNTLLSVDDKINVKCGCGERQSRKSLTYEDQVNNPFGYEPDPEPKIILEPPPKRKKHWATFDDSKDDPDDFDFTDEGQ